MQTTSPVRTFSLLAAIAFVVIAPVMGYIRVGLPPVLIIGSSAIVAFFLWYFTYFRRPAHPKVILPLFILTVAGLQVHITEEYLAGFGPAMSRLFDIPWTERSFLMVFALIGPTIYTLTTLGLYYRTPIAGFIAWFIFIGPGVAEFTHFIFPLMQPHLAPENPHVLTETIRGTRVADMPNYYYRTTGHYYFAGMWTAVLPMIPGIYAIFRLLNEHRRAEPSGPGFRVKQHDA